MRHVSSTEVLWLGEVSKGHQNRTVFRKELKKSPVASNTERVGRKEKKDDRKTRLQIVLQIIFFFFKGKTKNNKNC